MRRRVMKNETELICPECGEPVYFVVEGSYRTWGNIRKDGDRGWADYNEDTWDNSEEYNIKTYLDCRCGEAGEYYKIVGDRVIEKT